MSKEQWWACADETHAAVLCPSLRKYKRHGYLNWDNFLGTKQLHAKKEGVGYAADSKLGLFSEDAIENKRMIPYELCLQ